MRNSKITITIAKKVEIEKIPLLTSEGEREFMYLFEQIFDGYFGSYKFIEDKDEEVDVYGLEIFFSDGGSGIEVSDETITSSIETILKVLARDSKNFVYELEEREKEIK